MKEKIDALIVVEGKSDVAYLSSYFDCEFVTTNGSDIPESTIKYLKEAKANGKNIVVLTDPDAPGKRIRDVLDQNIPGLSHSFIEKKFAVKNGKVGVAECDINEVKRALQNQYQPKTTNVTTLCMDELYDLGLTGCREAEELRNKVSSKLSLGYVNAKTLLKRLNSLGITREQLEKIINE